MRKFTLISLSILSLFLYSCDNEIDLLSEGKDVPIVYGLINLSDSATYIRVEKSFADPNVPPAELAQDPSNLYYDNISVQLSDINGDGQVITLKRVDGNKEGYKRGDGAFAKAPNYLYKVMNSKLNFDDNSIAKLIIVDADADTILASAQTNVIDSIRISYPNNVSVSSLRILPKEILRFRLFSDINQEEIAYFIGSLQYVIKEYDAESHKLLRRIPQTVYSDRYKSQYDIKFPPILFYTKLSETLEPSTQVYREIDSVYVQVNCYGNELNEYKEIQLLNSGITSSSIIPLFNNIEKGRGLFSSSSSAQSGPFALSQMTIDSLNSFSITEGLNFKQ